MPEPTETAQPKITLLDVLGNVVSAIEKCPASTHGRDMNLELVKNYILQEAPEDEPPGISDAESLTDGD